MQIFRQDVPVSAVHVLSKYRRMSFNKTCSKLEYVKKKQSNSYFTAASMGFFGISDTEKFGSIAISCTSARLSIANDIFNKSSEDMKRAGDPPENDGNVVPVCVV